MKLLGSYRNGNYTVSIFDDGTKIRETEEDEFVASFPESFDCKICNRCDMGCPQCHEKSTCDGKLGNLNRAFIKTLKPYTEIACLSGDTIVHTKMGSMEIKDLKIGDEIFDSEHKLRKITNIQRSDKNVYQIKGHKGIKIKCSEDHPFLSNGKLVTADKMKGKNIDYLSATLINETEKYVIDMGKYVNPKKDIPGSRGGKFLPDGRIMLKHNSVPIQRYISLTPELMFAYGLYVAEGSTRNYTLNINEEALAREIGAVWVKTFNSSYFDIIKHEDRNSLDLELRPAALMDVLFKKEMQSGTGARNKSLRYLYHINDISLIRAALAGLVIGDGCFRKRKNAESVAISLKTTSKYLAYDYAYLIAKWFGVYSSVYHGMSPERKLEGRVLKASDYYMVDIYGYDNCKKVLGKYFPLEDTRKFVEKNKKTYREILDFQPIEKNEVLYDITLDGGTHIFPINGYVLTHNCGGGNILEQPDLNHFLKELKELKVIPSATVNQVHFERYKNYLKALTDNELLYGLGISLNNPTEEFISKVKEFPNAVIHVIAGLFTEADYNKLKNRGLKILILGYKHFGRGDNYYEKHSIEIENNISWLKNNLKTIVSDFEVVSFDNLALEQLNVRSIMSPEEWETFYMGNDGSHTMYIDMVEGTFAKTSTSTQRYPIMDTIEEMFEIIKAQS